MISPMDQILSPTKQTYNELQEAYNFFNKRLYSNKLNSCLITLQRKPRSYGYFCKGRFFNRDGRTTDEIALNPVYFESRTDRGVLSTLVHEMTHLWQWHFGNPGRRGYHNRQWAREMIRIGLCPSATGQPGGKETGYQMTHYILDGGEFEDAYCELDAMGFRLSWVENNNLMVGLAPPTSKATQGTTDGSNRWKYSCPRCRFNAWAKPNGKLICGNCNTAMPKSLR